MKYVQRFNGVGFEVPTRTIWRMACCECNLVHDFVFVPSKNRKTIGIAAKVNKRATAARRRP